MLPDHRPSFHRAVSHLAIWLLAAMLIGAFWWHTDRMIDADLTQTRVSTETELVNLGRLSEEHAERTLHSIDQLLRIVQLQYGEHHGKIDFKQMDQKGLIDHDVLIQLSVTDAQGILQSSSIPFSGRIDLADRAHFRFQQAAKIDELFISQPVLGRHSGKWSIQLVRRLTTSNGEFAGVVVASLDPGYFTRFYRQLRLGTQPLVSMFGLDGAILFRHSQAGDQLTGSVARSAFFPILAQGEQVATLTYPSVVDGVERTYHFRKLPSFPLVITVGRETQEIFAEHRAKSDFLMQLGRLLSVLVLSLAMLASWFLFSRQRHASAERHALARLQNITEQAPGMLFQLLRKADGRFSLAFASEGKRQLFQLDPTSVASELSQMFRLTHPDDAAELEASIQNSARNLSLLSHRYRICLADGSVRWLSGAALPQRQADGSVLWNGYLGDITGSQLLKEALRESARSEHLHSEELTRLLDLTPAAILIAHDALAAVITGNQLAYQWAGLPAGENLSILAPGRTATYTSRILHKGIELSLAELPLQRAAAGELVSDFEIELDTHDGHRHLLANAVPLFDESGSSRGAIAAFVDITAHHQANLALIAARKEADLANNAKSRFLAAVSHDLRQPLAALSLYVAMLKDKVRPRDQAMVTNMSDCVVNLAELLCNLLDLSKLQANAVKPDLENFSVAEMLSGLESVHGPVARAKGLQLRCASSRLIAHSDPVLFRRILSNLMANAVRYTESGAIVVGVRRARGKRWIEVRDSGIGIADDKLGQIFDEFTQLADKTRNVGSGLGLSIVAKMAALLGLEVRVTSLLGRGSIFAIELPPGH